GALIALSWPGLGSADRASLTFGRTIAALLLRPAGPTMIAIALRLTKFRTRHAIGLLTLAELRPASATSWTGILALFAGFALKERRARDVLHHRQLLADQTLDLAQLGRLGRIAKRDGLAFRSVTSGAADAVNIALRLVRKVEVYHMAD